jgi:UDP-N-acetylglucosamine 1-carboxyvinyltransferase
MDKIRIRGGKSLQGRIAISGAKNAALPILAAALLTEGPVIVDNVPDLADIAFMRRLLETLGAHIEQPQDVARRLRLSTRAITNTTAEYDLVRKMRASVLVLGPLLARTGEAKVSLPGGCAIGPRPVDLHLKGLEELGAKIELRQGYIHATAPRGLRGAKLRLALPSVGATENLMMAASLADGETVIANAAREPEVADLARCLVAMGAGIEGIGTGTLSIRGTPRLGGATYAVLPDRIELGTYAMAAAISRGELELVGGRIDLIGTLAEKLHEAGRRHDPALPGLSDRSAGAVHGLDVHRPGCCDDHRGDLREPLHARARADPDGGADHRARWLGLGARRAAADRRAGHGDRSARFRVPDPGGACGRRRDRGEPRLSPRPGL